MQTRTQVFTLNPEPDPMLKNLTGCVLLPSLVRYCEVVFARECILLKKKFVDYILEMFELRDRILILSVLNLMLDTYHHLLKLKFGTLRLMILLNQFQGK